MHSATHGILHVQWSGFHAVSSYTDDSLYMINAWNSHHQDRKVPDFSWKSHSS